MKNKVVIKALKEGGIMVYEKDKDLYIDKDHFPQSCISEANDIKLNLDGVSKKVDKVFDELEMNNYIDNNWDENKKLTKMVAKSITKAVKKYQDKCTNGYDPENIEDDMAKYIKKKTEKYVEKKFSKYIDELKKEEINTKESDASEEDKEEDDVEK